MRYARSTRDKTLFVRSMKKLKPFLPGAIAIMAAVIVSICLIEDTIVPYGLPRKEVHIQGISAPFSGVS